VVVKKKKRGFKTTKPKDKVRKVLQTEPLLDGLREEDVRNGNDPEGSGYWALRKNNPHCQQSLKRNSEATQRFTRVLEDNAPRRKYRVRPDHEKSVLHWGQRKLLLSEIEFLLLQTQQTQLDCKEELETKEETVVYAGAASGRHITYLSELFPRVKFILIDPNSFSILPNDRIEIRTGEEEGFFTDETAEEFKEKKILFISDIRTANHYQMNHDENEARVVADQKAQKRWLEVMKPKAAMLKFRLPYYPGKTSYFDGKIFLPIWGPQSTTETRLMVEDPTKLRNYENTRYEEQMFHFNSEARSLCYAHDVEATGLDYCYDCRAEVEVFGRYLLANPSRWLDKENTEIFLKKKKEKTEYELLSTHGLLLLGHPGSQSDRVQPNSFLPDTNHPAAIISEVEKLRINLMANIGEMCNTANSFCSNARTLATKNKKENKKSRFANSNLNKILSSHSLPKGLEPESWNT